MTHDLHPPGESGRSDPLIGVTRRVTSMFVLWLWSVLRWRSDAARSPLRAAQASLLRAFNLSSYCDKNTGGVTVNMACQRHNL